MTSNRYGFDSVLRSGIISITWSCLVILLIANFNTVDSNTNNGKDVKPASQNVKPFTIELHHKFGTQSEYSLRGVITVNPQTQHRASQAEISQRQLSQEEMKLLKKSHENNELYYLRATTTTKSGDTQEARVVQTLTKSCSIYMSNLVDFIDINLSQINEFISINIFGSNPECSPDKSVLDELVSNTFNTTVNVVHSVAGPYPDTTTYIKRMEEERDSKLRDDKRDNRSFFGKYWIYIVAAVLLLMTFSGPSQEQAGR